MHLCGPPALPLWSLSIVPQTWKDVRRDCKGLDAKRSGRVDSARFRGILRKHGVALTNEQFYQVLSHLDSTMSHTVAYDDFFREVLRA